MADTQRRFAVMGANTFKIADKIMSNQRICRLLKYQVRNPFSPDLKDVDGAELINKQILIVPKIYDGSNEKMSYVTAIFDDFVVNQINPEFKISTVRFDIACPYDEWLLDDTSFSSVITGFSIKRTFKYCLNVSYPKSTISPRV